VNRLVPVKSKGIPVYVLLVLLSLFCICGESIFSFYCHGFYGLGKLGKNYFYHFQNYYLMDWCRLLLCTTSCFFRLLKKENSTASEAPQAFIPDDISLKECLAMPLWYRVLRQLMQVLQRTSHTQFLTTNKATRNPGWDLKLVTRRLPKIIYT
jgi:hypothetical protein